MKSPLLYVVELLASSGVLLLVWRTLLARHISLRASRIYLLLVPVLAAAIPMCAVPLWPAAEPAPVTLPPGITTELLRPDAEPSFAPSLAPSLSSSLSPSRVYAYAAPPARAAHPFDWTAAAGVLYAAGALWALVRVGIRCARLAALRRQARVTRCAGYAVAQSAAVAAPFSFMRTVFLPLDTPREELERILSHERSHIRHRHSAERMAMELLRAVLWFDPFVGLAARSLAEVHEWEADRDVLAAGCDLETYRRMLLHQLFGCNPDITCGLAHLQSTTKKRFIMMTKTSKDRLAPLRLATAAAVAAGLFLAFGCTVRATAAKNDGAPTPTDPLHTITITAEGYLFDGVPVDSEGLAARLQAMPDSLRASTIDITAAHGTSYERVIELKTVLRDNRLQCVRFSATPSDAERSQIIVVVAGAGNRASLGAMRIRTDAGEEQPALPCYQVTSDSSDEALSEMERSVKQWLASVAASGMAEAGAVELGVPYIWLHSSAQPQAVVHLLIDKQASYRDVVRTQQMLHAACDAQREACAQGLYGRPMARLNEAERNRICEIVPMRIDEKIVPMSIHEVEAAAASASQRSLSMAVVPQR